jgi:hypothetical protein
MHFYLGTEINYSEIFHGFSQSNQEDTDILGFMGHHMVSSVVVTILQGCNVSFFKVDMNLTRFSRCIILKQYQYCKIEW